MNDSLLNTGIYSIQDAARLTHVSSWRIRRWLRGYQFSTKNVRHHSSPVWIGQHVPREGKMAVGFKDLMEIRYVEAFLQEGVSWKTMRAAHSAAKTKLQMDHPFCTNNFVTDGRDILLQEAKEANDQSLFNIVNNQREFSRIVSPFLKELEIDREVIRWWPLGKERSVVVDPTRNLGQPTATQSGIPTQVLARGVKSNGSIDLVASWFAVNKNEVLDAVEFENKWKIAA